MDSYLEWMVPSSLFVATLVASFYKKGRIGFGSILVGFGIALAAAVGLQFARTRGREPVPQPIPVNARSSLYDSRYDYVAGVILQGDGGQLKQLIKQNPKLVDEEPGFEPPILCYAAKSNLDSVRLLLQENPKLAVAKDSHGKTVLNYLAAQWRHSPDAVNIAKLVIDGNNDLRIEGHPQLLSAIDDEGKTILHEAAMASNYMFTKLLVEREPKLVKVRDSSGMTAIDIARHEAAKPGARRELEDIVSLLEETEAQLDHSPKVGVDRPAVEIDSSPRP